MSEAIITAQTIMRESIYTALAARMGDYQHNRQARCYYSYKSDPAAPLPCIIFQFQTPIIDETRYFDEQQYAGTVRVRGLAQHTIDAETILHTVVPGLATLAAPAGYDIDSAFQQVVPVAPVQEGVTEAAQQYRITLKRRT